MDYVEQEYKKCQYGFIHSRSVSIITYISYGGKRNCYAECASKYNKKASASELGKNNTAVSNMESEAIDTEETPENMKTNKASASNLADERATNSELLKLEPGEVALVNDLKPKETISVEENKLVEETMEKQEIVENARPIGTWTVDGITTYRFDENGTGALILPEHEYAFSYDIEEDQIMISFANSKIRDTVFQYEMAGDTLKLERYSEAGSLVAILHKE